MFCKTVRRTIRIARLWVLACTALALTLITAAAQDPAPAAPAAQSDEAEAPAQSAPVTIDGVVLFSVRGVSSYSAERRAHTIAKTIENLAANPEVSPQSLRLEETPLGTQIMSGSRVVMMVLDGDARLEAVSRQILAPVIMKRIRETIEAYRRDREPALTARRAVYALFATIAALAAFFAARRIFPRLRAGLERRYKEKVHGTHIQSFQVVQADRLWPKLSSVLGLIWGLILTLAGYFYLHYVLWLFPGTRGFANNIFAIVVRPLRTMGNGLLDAMPGLIFLAFLAVVTRYLLRLVHVLFDAVEKGTITWPGFDAEWAKPTGRLVRFMVIAFALVVGYPYIPGSDSQAFKGVSLLIGVIFSLGSSSLIGNLIAGYSMAYRRTFKPGDRVKIGEHVGIVEQTSLMVTYLRNLKNEMVVVPNSMIINGDVVNYTMLARRDGLILHTNVGIGYETPWRQVEALLLEAAARTPGLVTEPKPFVLQKELGDFAITYEINAYCHEPNGMGLLYTAMHQNILDLFNEYGVQIMTPSYEGDPEQAKVVPKDQWFTAPARPPKPAPTTPPVDTRILHRSGY